MGMVERLGGLDAKLCYRVRPWKLPKSCQALYILFWTTSEAARLGRKSLATCPSASASK